MRFFHWVIDHPVAVVSSCAVMLCVGVAAMFMLPVELSPQTEAPSLTVRYTWPGTLSALAVEADVTAPLEGALQTCRDITRISSITWEGGGAITLDIARRARPDMVELEVGEIISQAFRQLPKGVTYPEISRSVPQEVQNLQSFIRMYLVGDQSPARLRLLAERIIHPSLSSIPGVASVDISGGARQVVELAVFPDALQRFNIPASSLDLFLTRLGFRERSAGTITQGPNKRAVYVRGAEFAGAEDIARQPVSTSPDGRVITARDIGTIRMRDEIPGSILRVDGCDVVAVDVSKERGADEVATASRVKKEMDRIRSELPAGVRLTLESDGSEQLSKELDTIGTRTLFAILFITIVMFLVFRRFATALVIVATVVVSVVATLGLYYVFHVSVNMLTLSALTMGLGIIVDNAVVVYDSIHKRVEQLAAERHDTCALKQAVARGAAEMAIPVLASNLTTIGALAPVLFLSENFRQYLQPFLFALGIALLLSQTFSFTLMPCFAFRHLARTSLNRALLSSGTASEQWVAAGISFLMAHKRVSFCAIALLVGIPVWLLPDKIEPRSSGLPTTAAKKYRAETRAQYLAVLAKAPDTAVAAMEEEQPHMPRDSWFDKPRAALVKIYNDVWGSDVMNRRIKPALYSILGGSTYLFFNKVPRGSMFRSSRETSITVNIEMPENASMVDIDEICRGYEREIDKYSFGIKRYTTDIYYRGRAGITIDIKDSLAYTGFPMSLYGLLQRRSIDLGGIGVSVQGFGPGFAQGFDNTYCSYSIGVRGYNFNRVYAIAREIADKLGKNQRVRDLSIDMLDRSGTQHHEIFLTLDRQRLMDLGLEVGSVRQEIAGLLFGHGAGSMVPIRGEETEFRIDYRRKETPDVEEMKTWALGQAGKVRLGDVVRFEKRPVLPLITRENQSYFRMVTFNFIGQYDLGLKLAKLILKKTSIPYGYSATVQEDSWGGNEQENREFLWIILLSVLVVWMITSALYESVTKSLLVFLAIPLAAIGFFYSFNWFGASFDRGGYVACLLLAGIAVNNSIILVSHIYNQLKERPGAVREVVALAAAHRLRPIMVTSVATIAGLLPQVFFEKSDAIWYPMAVGIIGGLVSSSILILFVIPAITEMTWGGARSA